MSDLTSHVYRETATPSPAPQRNTSSTANNTRRPTSFGRSFSHQQVASFGDQYDSDDDNDDATNNEASFYSHSQSARVTSSQAATTTSSSSSSTTTASTTGDAKLDNEVATTGFSLWTLWDLLWSGISVPLLQGVMVGVGVCTVHYLTMKRFFRR